MDFRVTLQYRNEIGEGEHLLGFMDAPDVLAMFNQLNWKNEIEEFQKLNHCEFPVLVVEDLTQGQVFRMSAHGSEHDLNFYSECHVLGEKKGFLGFIKSKVMRYFAADALPLEDVRLALALFLADDQQQLTKLYRMSETRYA